MRDIYAANVMGLSFLPCTVRQSSISWSLSVRSCTWQV